MLKDVCCNCILHIKKNKTLSITYAFVTNVGYLKTTRQLKHAFITLVQLDHIASES